MTDRLKIGQEVLIHGYIDEIRKDTIIIRNDGGYFGTVKNEISPIPVMVYPQVDGITPTVVLSEVRDKE